MSAGKVHFNLQILEVKTRDASMILPYVVTDCMRDFAVLEGFRDHSNKKVPRISPILSTGSDGCAKCIIRDSTDSIEQERWSAKP